MNDKVLTSGDFILYWMQQSQRVTYNHALEYSIYQANKYHKHLLVLFVVDISFPEANLRHFSFMFAGLQEVDKKLRERNIRLVIVQGDMVKEVTKFADKAFLLVSDYGYLKIQREWREKIALVINKPFICLESDIVVPVEVASDKQEYMARTIRNKIEKVIDDYLIPFVNYQYQGEYLDNFNKVQLSEIMPQLDSSVQAVSAYLGGYSHALRRLKDFIKHKLPKYHLKNKDLVHSTYSELSPYLHFGQISVMEIIDTVNEAEVIWEAKQSFFEQLIIRRELAINYCYYNSNYDNFDYINPSWAKDTLDFHALDQRVYLYELNDLENANTHDSAWNSAQQQMVKTGYMHNYLRMYWGKKIMEWSISPREAYYNILYLNNKYLLDGRDPNSFTGIAWCFGNHDTPWRERDIFGKVRYMNYQGLKRKFDIKSYEQEWLK